MTIWPRSSPAGRWDSTSTWTPGWRCRAGARWRMQRWRRAACRSLQRSSGGVGCEAAVRNSAMRQPAVTVDYDYAHSENKRFVLHGDWLGASARAGAKQNRRFRYSVPMHHTAVEPISHKVVALTFISEVSRWGALTLQLNPLAREFEPRGVQFLECGGRTTARRRG